MQLWQSFWMAKPKLWKFSLWLKVGSEIKSRVKETVMERGMMIAKVNAWWSYGKSTLSCGSESERVDRIGFVLKLKSTKKMVVSLVTILTAKTYQLCCAFTMKLITTSRELTCLVICGYSDTVINDYVLLITLCYFEAFSNEIPRNQ